MFVPTSSHCSRHNLKESVDFLYRYAIRENIDPKLAKEAVKSFLDIIIEAEGGEGEEPKKEIDPIALHKNRMEALKKRKEAERPPC